MITTDILIIGGGPAGLTAGLYAARSGRKALILEKEGFGGQIAYSPRVENYPGIASIAGAELAESMLMQAMDAGAETDVATVCSLAFENGLWIADTEDGGRYAAPAVIVAAGARHRQLGLPGEEDLCGSGVSYCAVCDGSFYKGQDVAVAGGGDTALQEALLLSGICRSVTLIHRRRSFRAEEALVKAAQEKDNIRFCLPCTVEALLSDAGELRGVTVKDVETGESRELDVKALFVAYGQEPATAPFASVLRLSGAGYVTGDAGEALAPGLFAAGDCRDKSVRQLTTAVGDGACAALAACRYLEGRDRG